MTEDRTGVVCVGEVRIELARDDDGRFALAYGGDTFNAAIYLARAGLPVAYATALGDDLHSDRICDFAAAEGISRRLMLRVPGRQPALSLIEADAGGGRLSADWVEAAPARDLFELADWGGVAEGLLSGKLILFSGMTLALYSNTGLGRFLAVLEVAREKGAVIAFDTNYRPLGWRGDVARARTVYAEALKRVDIALAGFDDEAALWGDAHPEATVERLQAFGIAEIAVKNGAADALIATPKGRDWVPVPDVVEVVDATAAGDGFSAGYIAARLSGEAPAAAALPAHRLAREVVRHRGAILPRAANAMH